MTFTRSWRVRSYQPGDEHLVPQLFAAVFPKTQSSAEYRWKFVDVPWASSTPNIWLAAAGERIVGQYGGAPVRYKLGEAIMPTIHVCDVMTAPAYRRQGILTAVGDAANKAWTEGDVAFSYALTYQGLLGSRLQYLGWQPQFTMHWFHRPLHLGHLLKRPIARLLTPALAAASRLWRAAWSLPLRRAADDTAVETITRPGPEFDALWEELHPHYHALLVRDRAWLAYRYVDAPWNRYTILLARRNDRPVGYLVYRLTGKGRQTTGWIIDLFTAPQDKAARAALLRTALDALYQADAGSARVLLAGDGRLTPEFHRYGFFQTQGYFDISLVPFTEGLPATHLRTPDGRLILAGDFDII